MLRNWIVPVLLVAVAGCTADGQFRIFGYTTEPNYDSSIRTVYVPIFKNDTMRRGIEFDMTRAVIREIESKTPFKVTSNPATADTELVGKIVQRRKSIINTNQLNEVREAETAIAVEILWLDLRAGHQGECLSGKRPEPAADVLDPKAPPPSPIPVLITPVASFIPELGGSLTSAEFRVVNQLAVQIVSMMEVWK